MKTKKLVYLSLITTIGTALNILESFIPLPISGVPGAKLGLANIVNLVALVVFGLKYGLIVGILRSILATLGTGAVTGLFYSLSGAIVSTIVMWIVYNFFSKKFSLIGVSIFGALAHNIAQLSVASVMIHNVLIFTYLPLMMLMSLFTGYFIGLSSNYISNHLKNILGNNNYETKEM
ncbi:Gx transporter family protein [Anaerophilus nitritogenes]|uniref:Gx transporter family protein n=1 Tax=Anaerophilus nitritogenes TaxID=2498136 RepID=UPI00101BBA11|nr:Gx transporter family protein [Anaerophilus nitritogenes]